MHGCTVAFHIIGGAKTRLEVVFVHRNGTVGAVLEGRQPAEVELGVMQILEELARLIG